MGGKRVLIARQAMMTAQTTLNVAATTTSDALSTGFQISLLVHQQLWIKRYICGISNSANRSFTIITAGAILIERSPFGPGQGLAVYQDPYIPPHATPNVPTSGSFPAQPGYTIMLVDDWFEYDDYFGLMNPFVVQLQSAWTVRNASGAADNLGIGPEFCAFEIWEDPKVGEGDP